MVESQNQKIDELLGKLRGLADRAKSTRAQFGSPLVDRALERLNRISTKLPSGNGHAVNQPPQQPQTPLKVLKVCPKCGRPFNENVDFCNCGFSFRAEEIEERRKREAEERLERLSKFGVIS